MPRDSNHRKRKRLFDHVYDWANSNTDLNHLEAAMLALGVFLFGLCLIGSMFILGKVQAITSHQQAVATMRDVVVPARHFAATWQLGTQSAALSTPYTYRRATMFRLPAPVPVTYAGASAPLDDSAVSRLFGRPRLNQGFSSSPFQPSRVGQAEASIGSWQ
jgi:hypothetical protein